ncbi:hypothetical protein SUGI_0508850 [Cryptomeria japonica]|nr:hypothetical protein SUGI_0508850 [Cryptomeria japonica]
MTNIYEDLKPKRQGCWWRRYRALSSELNEAKALKERVFKWRSQPLFSSVEFTISYFKRLREVRSNRECGS